MQYSNINLENAEDILQEMTDKDDLIKDYHNVWERNGVKYAGDRHRLAVILPDGTDEWDLSDVYFETMPNYDVNKIFNAAKQNSVLNFKITKKQAKDLLVYLNGLKCIIKDKELPVSMFGEEQLESDFEEEQLEKKPFLFAYTFYDLGVTYDCTPMKIKLNIDKTEFVKYWDRECTRYNLLCRDYKSTPLTMPAKLNVNKMEFVKEWSNEQSMIAFNPHYIKEALSFILCSDNEYIEVYYVSSTSVFFMKSAQLYVGIAPVRMDKKDKYNFRNSHDIAEYCRKINKTWTPFEMAVISRLSHSTLAEKLTVFRELISDYPDMPVPDSAIDEGFDSLHQKLAELIDYQERLVNLFEKPESGCDVLGSAVYAWHDESVFLTLEETLIDIREYFESGEKIKIIIKKLFGDNGNNGIIEATVDCDGNIYSIDGRWSLDYVSGDLGEQLHQLLFGKNEFKRFLFLICYKSGVCKKFELEDLED